MVKVITSSDGHGLADAGEGDDHDQKKGQESERYDEGATANEYTSILDVLINYELCKSATSTRSSTGC
jgi:hypothetical protein